MKRIKADRGLTLLEQLNAVAIFGVICVLTFGVFHAGDRLWKIADASAINRHEATRAVMEMERHIRECTDFEILDDIHKDTVRFTDQGQTIKYEFFGEAAESGYPAGTIIETIGSGEGAEKRVVANNIASLTFTLVEPDTGAGEKFKKVIIDIVAEESTLDDERPVFSISQVAVLRNTGS